MRQFNKFRFNQWGNVPVMAPTGGLQLGSLMIWMPIFALIMRDLGANDLQISAVVAVYTAGEAVAQYVGGRTADSIGRRPILIVSPYAAAILLLLGAFTGHWVWFSLMYILMRFFKGFQTPARTMIIGESVCPNMQGRAFGFVEMFIASMAVLGPLIGARLLPIVEGQRLLLITATGWAVSGFFRQRYLRETLQPNVERPRFSLRQLSRGGLLEVLLILIGLHSIFNLTFWGPFMALHGSDIMLLSRVQINVFYAIGSGFGALSSPWVGQIVDRFGVNRLLAVMSLVFGLTSLLWSFQRATPGIILCYIVMGISYQVTMIASAAFRLQMTTPDVRGAGLGACGMVSILVAAMVVPVMGYLRTLIGPHVPFVFAGLLSAGVAYRLLWLEGRLKDGALDWITGQ